MSKHDLASGTFFLLFGLSITLYAPQFDLGNLHRPGSGFMPFLSGLLICGFSGLMLIRSFFDKSGAIEEIWGEVRFMKLLIALLILVAYGLLLKPLGFLPSSFFLIITLTHYIGSRRWLSSFLLALFVSIAAYLVFGAWLKVTLPRGIFGV